MLKRFKFFEARPHPESNLNSKFKFKLPKKEGEKYSLVWVDLDLINIISHTQTSYLSRRRKALMR